MTYQQSPLVDAYIAQFHGDVKERLILLRKAVQAAFPKTIEDISYDMPTYRPQPEKRGVVHFGTAKGHIGIYAIFEPKSNAPMHKKIEQYRSGKGTLRFENTKPFPITTIRQILTYHASQIDM